MARQKGIGIIPIQHIANPEMGIAPFPNKDTEGADIHTLIRGAAPDAPVVVKEFADSFDGADLKKVISV